ncbi:uncharacterized protein LOC119906229 [Micropterus salmoides]|uniref:uncharacterized protein LOC119906229 n=1 Tax=Micropterus salmoides TaxID=27706 RepID=UPI0018ECDF27|nr:uncharacterized protein LOC119906229 [Micropterus salmoides]
MSQKVLFIKMLLVHYATQSLPEIHASCKEDVPLKCPDVDIDSMDFLSVTWYKMTNKGKSGIIRRAKGEETTQNYNFSRPARFGEKHSLFLRSVTPEDSGTYECFISANVGGQNKYLKVALTVNECTTQAELTTMTNVLNTTHSDLPCHKQVEDLPFMWSIIGYVAVGLTKIILSLISIWVIRALRVRSSRRRQHLW